MSEEVYLKRPLHCIVGGGNLGMALANQLKRQGRGVQILTRRLGFSYPKHAYGVSEISEHAPEVIWLTSGSGSVGGNFLQQLDTHFRLVVETLAAARPETRVIAFSTDYVANQQRPSDPECAQEPAPSLYAYSKLMLEQWARLQRDPRLRIVRLGSLYGGWKPAQCFPLKLLQRNPLPGAGPVILPANLVTPTPTVWAATLLTEQLDALYNVVGPVVHLAPQGNVSIADWGRRILGDAYQVKMGPVDQDRPAISNLGTSFVPEVEHWADLWKVHATAEVLGKAPSKLA